MNVPSVRSAHRKSAPDSLAAEKSDACPLALANLHPIKNAPVKVACVSTASLKSALEASAPLKSALFAVHVTNVLLLMTVPMKVASVSTALEKSALGAVARSKQARVARAPARDSSARLVDAVLNSAFSSSALSSLAR